MTIETITPAEASANRKRAREEIRAIFSNEIECLSEGAMFVADGLVILERTIRLRGMNAAEGKTCTSHLVYALHADGYWEQVASYTTEWEA